MVFIVVPENSWVDMINAGLTLRYYQNKGESPTVYLANESDYDIFWKTIRDFVDPKDKTLVILNLPLPSAEVLKDLDLKPYEYAIVYIPSQFIPITPQIKKLLLEKGIVSMPQRAPYKCFPGEYTSEVEKRWMGISKIISLDDEFVAIGKEKFDIIGGLLRRIEEDVSESIRRIAANDLNFFLEAGKKPLAEVKICIEKPDANILLVSHDDTDLTRVALNDFLESGKTPVGVSGEAESIILTIAPTFASEVIRKSDFEVKSQTRLGKGAIFSLRGSDPTILSLLVGKLARETIPIKFNKPRHVIRKTLMRRLVGGPGPYGRTYRGVKGLNKEMISKDIISAPQVTVEAVVDVLKESGSGFEFII